MGRSRDPVEDLVVPFLRIPLDVYGVEVSPVRSIPTLWGDPGAPFAIRFAFCGLFRYLSTLVCMLE